MRTKYSVKKYLTSFVCLFAFLKVAFKLSFVHISAQKMLDGDFIYPDIMEWSLSSYRDENSL